MVTLMIALGILLGFLLVEYSALKPVRDVVVGSSLFLSFWQFVMSLTITLRGNQASDAGFPQNAARKTVIAFGWIETSCSFLTAVCMILVMLDIQRLMSGWLPRRGKMHAAVHMASEQKNIID